MVWSETVLVPVRPTGPCLKYVSDRNKNKSIDFWPDCTVCGAPAVLGDESWLKMASWVEK